MTDGRIVSYDRGGKRIDRKRGREGHIMQGGGRERENMMQKRRTSMFYELEKNQLLNGACSSKIRV